MNRMCLSISFLLLVVSKEKSFANDFCWLNGPIYAEATIAYDDFRGMSEGTWTGNSGALVGTNLGIPLLDIFALQAGGSYGVYDWTGRGLTFLGIPNSVQQQGFMTVGLFHEKLCRYYGFQSSLVLDWMFNKNFGVFALNPSCGQLRLQIGYLLNTCNELGVWGTLNVNTDHETFFEIPIAFRAISQVNLFWRHFFEGCAEATFWAGLPYKKSLMFPGERPGKYILGASVRVPLTSCLDLDAHAVYMSPRGNLASPRFANDAVNICLGFTYIFGGCADCDGDFQTARPYLSIANNSNFLMETNLSD